MKATLPQMALVAVSLCWTPLLCEGSISYTWVNQGMYTAGEPISYELDFNQDSVIDLLFESTGMWFDVMPPNDNRVIAGGNNVHALSEGTAIGSSTPTNDWLQGYLGHLGINSCAVLPPPDGGTCSGEFIATTAYMGVKFYIDDFEYYGWVRISNPFDGISGGTIMDYAYETDSGIGILAGAGIVPEPTTIALLSAGAFLLAVRYRRTKK